MRIVGTRARGGARKIVQCRTSTRAFAACAGAAPGTRARRGRRPSSRPGAAPAERRELDVGMRSETALQPAHPARGAGARLQQRGDVEPDLHATASSNACRWISPQRRQVNCAACAIPAARSSSRRSIASLIACGDRVGVVGVDADRGVAAGLVHRRVRRRDDRDAARHRLHDRHPEPLEPRRVDERSGAAHQLRHLAVCDEAELEDRRRRRAAADRPNPRRPRPRAPARRATAATPRPASRDSCAARAWRG